MTNAAIYTMAGIASVALVSGIVAVGVSALILGKIADWHEGRKK